MDRAKIIRQIAALVIVAAAMTVLFLGMRAVMAVGGACAEGGPYVVAIPCPKGVGAMVPLAIFAGIGGAFLYAASAIPGGPNYTLLLWTALFCSLGWNFFEFGFRPPTGDSIVGSWIFCGVLFWVMGLAPVIFSGWRGLLEFFVGSAGGGDPWALNGPSLIRTVRRIRERRGVQAPEGFPDAADAPRADEIQRLAHLRDRGVMSPEEYRHAMTVLMGGGATQDTNPAPPANASPADPTAASLAAELERLAKLHRSGALTDAEYRAAKLKMIGGG